MKTKTTLRLTYLDGFFFAIMVASAESFALYYFAKQGIGATQLAILSTVPILIAAVFQLLVPHIISHKRLGVGIVSMILLQLIGLCGLVFSVMNQDHFWGPLVALTLYWSGGQGAGPLWLDWVAQFCPREEFENFYGKRTATLQFIILFLFIAFAYALESWLSFLVLFFIGACARTLSMAVMIFCNRHAQPLAAARAATLQLSEEHTKKGDEFKQSLRIFFIFVIAGGLFRFSVNTSSPFFLTYMIQDLGVSTTQFVWLSSVPLAGKILFQVNWANGRLQGYQYLGVQVSCFIIAFLPWLWTVSNNLIYLMIIQALSGIFWGGLEFMHVMLAQNLAYGESRKYASIQQALFHLFALAGALVGGYLLDHFWTASQVFHLSTGLRLLAAGLLAALAWKYSLSRMNVKKSFIYLATVISIKPTAANMWRLVPLRVKRRRIRQN